jgi:chorismate mutase
MLARVRREIDTVDEQLVELIRVRLGLACAAGRLRGRGRDPQRESDILANVAGEPGDALSLAIAGLVYPRLFEASALAQRLGLRLGGYLASSGTAGEAAVKSHDGEAIAVRVSSMEVLLGLCKSGAIDFAIVPDGGAKLAGEHLNGLVASRAVGRGEKGLAVVTSKLGKHWARNKRKARRRDASKA